MILSIETATELCGAALVHDGRCAAVRTVAEKNIHSERLMVLVDEVLKEAGAAIGSLDGIAVSIGPGSFTGLRIGLSAAKGLAYAQSLPLVAVPTLDSIAEEAMRVHAAGPDDVICALIDAKRDEAYYAFYTEGGSIRLPGGPAIASVSVIAEEAGRHAASGARMIVAGDGARKIAPHMQGITGAVTAEQVLCSPVSVGVIAGRKFSELRVGDYSELEPLYIRDFVTTMPRVANQTAIP